ncbi:MAG: cyclase family protein [Bacteroidales bacterium]|nr:cyclase family protein [Bacteroidales bacterium]
MPEFIELSYTIEENMMVYPDTPSPEFKTIASIEQDGYREMIMKLTTHTGTHIDAEAHIYTTGKTIDQYNLDQFYGTAIVIDCSRSPVIYIEPLKKILLETSLPDFLLLYTGWAKFWGKNEYFTDFPVLNTSTAKFLSKLPIKGIGIDSVSFDNINNPQLTNHKILLKKGLILIENLKDLEQLIDIRFIFSCFPLKLSKGDSSPIRACAIIDT